MFVEKGQRTFNQRQIRGYVGTGIILRFQNHLAKFKNSVPFIFQPRIVFQSFVKPIRTFETIFCGVRQTEIFDLLAKASSIMLPIYTASQFRILQHPVIEIELGGHHVEVTAFQHRPVDKTLILCSHRPSSPLPVIRGECLLLVYVTGIEGE